MAVSKCAKCSANRGNSSEKLTSFGIDHQGSLAFCTVKFAHNRILTSQENGKKVHIHVGRYVDVYLTDLYHWIKNQGIFGITFQDSECQETFLTTYSDIRSYHYG